MNRLDLSVVLVAVAVVLPGCALDGGFDGFAVEGEGEFNTAITAPKSLTLHIVGGAEPQRYFVPVRQEGRGFGGVVDFTVTRTSANFGMAISEDEAAILNGFNYLALFLGDVASASVGNDDGVVDGFYFGLNSVDDADVDLTMRATVQLQEAGSVAFGRLEPRP